MSDTIIDYDRVLKSDASVIPLDEIDVAHPELFRSNRMWSYFERLRRDAPVHYCKDSMFGPYWSVTKYKDIMHVETNHAIFSSEAALGGITVRDGREDFRLPMFIAMDPPKHDAQRKVVSPIVAPANLAKLGETIRERAAGILDNLPINQTFDWVDRVSIELTTQMLATLFDFPFDERRKLTRWSDVATADVNSGIVESEEAREAELLECGAYFANLWNQRVNSEPKGDLISMMAHADATRNMEPMEYLGNVILLIVGGNDTTRNSLTGGVLALNENPAEYQKLRQNHGLIGKPRSPICGARRFKTPSWAASTSKRATRS
jgi:cytochrome P450